MHTEIPNPQCDSVTLMNLYGQEVREYPGIPDRNILLLRARLVFEETMEFVKAAGCYIDREVGGGGDLTVEIDPEAEPDLDEMVDAIGDIQVVNLGAACALGVDVQPVWDEIQHSNLSKRWAHCSKCDLELTHLGGGVFRHEPDFHHSYFDIVWKLHKREDGKILKPPYYQAADITSVINKQVDSYLQNLPHEVPDAA
jgi:predicted HAD superfamily Cof-like phosphohydrolase